MLFIHFKPGLLDTPVTPVLRRLRQNFKFKVSLHNKSTASLKNTKQMKDQFLNTSSKNIVCAVMKKSMCFSQ